MLSRIMYGCTKKLISLIELRYISPIFFSKSTQLHHSSSNILACNIQLVLFSATKMIFRITSLLFLITIIFAYPAFDDLTNPENEDNLIDEENPEDYSFDEHDRINVDLTYLGETIHTQPNEESGAKLAAYTPDSAGNPEEQGNYAEGDMYMPLKGKNGLLDKSYRWVGGKVPYVIAPSFNPSGKNMLNLAIAEYKSKTCINLVPRISERDYLYFTSDDTGCWSSVGRIGGEQQINLQYPGCLTMIGTPIHEIMHALGFLHEQSRHERDDFVTVQWSNILPGTETNFEKSEPGVEGGQNVTYDYASVMHYSATAFSSNGGKTIVTKTPGVLIGQRNGFSAGDLKKIRNMYNCTTRKYY